ncbi:MULTISPECIES: roadblock/LC7 domain-containing protein [unclassified Streptomyces]|uniref:roadblock/LC7 domain-containing protein n=1 Tax=unclassified Streptomyces TaxID=2593676 RepID=UPI002E34EA8E|nr:roadblock/LC7 domain-containing protein [Streptomyces sp. NBC_01358]MEE4495092.1 roadblock/LC7 domain-containing protein [Streptomyces sp. BE230]WSW65597.1 roadblock/LC7 domain-containing protein [Streptomyces sp. NBC_00995]
MTATRAPDELTQLLAGFVKNTSGAIGALVTSTDGMLIAHHIDHIDPDAPHTLSAVTSGLYSLSTGANSLLSRAGGVQYIMIMMDKGQLVAMAAGTGALFTLLTDEHADTEQVAYEASLLVKRIPAILSVAPRTPTGATSGPVT